MSEIDRQNIQFEPYRFHDTISGAYFYNPFLRKPVIAVNLRIVRTQEQNACLAHELGHHYTCPENLLYAPKAARIRCETLANRWALGRVMPPARLINAYLRGVRTLAELADDLEVSESFVQRGIALYNSIYGKSLQTGNWLITFEPFNIVEQRD
jgi:Zn-dependent peptidase ImmA (M78 family)